MEFKLNLILNCYPVHVYENRKVTSFVVCFLEPMERGHWTTSGNFKMMNKQGPEFWFFQSQCFVVVMDAVLF